MFYIVQMADFHFGGTKLKPDAESEEVILGKMREKILTEIPRGSEVIFCACGDYIDSKKVSVKTLLRTEKKRDLTDSEVISRYEEAQKVLKSVVIDPLEKAYVLKAGLCVGNHDTTHLGEVKRFSNALISRDIDEPYSIHLASDNADFIFINSCPPNEYEYGKIDYNALEDVLKRLSPNSTKYFVLHHALMSMDEGDKSSLRQVPKLIKLIDQYAVKAVFHGHTHGQYTIPVGTVGCPVIGVGAAYVRDYPNVNSQFNLICCDSGIPVWGTNYQYHADIAKNTGADGFTDDSIPVTKENNYFFGKKFSGLYEELLKKVRAESKLYHVDLHVKSSFKDFCSDVEENFGKQEELETLDAKYSYTQLAEMWEKPDRDDKVLYFNHGECFAAEQYPSGIDYIIHELGQKTTSNRAVLVTVNSKDISKTAPDALLPSLLSIHFGFDRGQTTLHVTMNLRALEASRFFKINICEVLFLAQKIHDIYPFASIEVVVSASSVQIKENFGCFLKAKLDTLARSNKIAAKLASLNRQDNRTFTAGKIDELICLIQDKKKRSETVIETVGVENLRDSIADVRDEMPDDRGAVKFQLNKVHTYTEELLKKLNELKKNRASSSEQTEYMDILEKEIDKQYELLIEGFEGLKKL